MPWCSSCDRFLSPPSVRADGTCPACGRPVEPGRARPGTPPEPTGVTPGAGHDEEDLGPIPWHLKLLAGAVALYLGYRALQGVEWIIDRF